MAAESVNLADLVDAAAGYRLLGETPAAGVLEAFASHQLAAVVTVLSKHTPADDPNALRVLRHAVRMSGVCA